jgi:hypothetical protein
LQTNPIWHDHRLNLRFRHGLSLPLRCDTEASAKADAIERARTGGHADDEHQLAATELAQAQVELLRIRAVRAELMATFDLSSGNIEHLRRLAALDPYERLAHTKRRLASGKL